MIKAAKILINLTFGMESFFLFTKLRLGTQLIAKPYFANKIYTLAMKRHE
jgi:hypothetical protein